MMRALDRRDSPTLYQRHIRWLVIHRLSLARKTEANPHPVSDQLLTGAHVLEAFLDRRMRTGGWTPYHALIQTDGTVEQLLRLSVRGQHATDVRPRSERRWYNWRTIALAVAGNADEYPPTQAQESSLVSAAVDLLPLCRELIGHTSLPFSSGDPDKRCPGQFLPLAPIAEAAELQLPDGWRQWDRAAERAAAVAGGWEF